jgi:hypothetical protein
MQKHVKEEQTPSSSTEDLREATRTVETAPTLIATRWRWAQRNRRDDRKTGASKR